MLVRFPITREAVGRRQRVASDVTRWLLGHERLKLVTERPDAEAEWWTTSDVAAYLGVQVTTVTNYRKRGQMPAPDATVGRTHMWWPSRMVAWHKGRPRPGVGGRPRSTGQRTESGDGDRA